MCWACQALPCSLLHAAHLGGVAVCCPHISFSLPLDPPSSEDTLDKVLTSLRPHLHICTQGFGFWEVPSEIVLGEAWG